MCRRNRELLPAYPEVGYRCKRMWNDGVELQPLLNHMQPTWLGKTGCNQLFQLLMVEMGWRAKQENLGSGPCFLSLLFRRTLEMCPDSLNCRTEEIQSDEVSASHCGVLPES